MEIKILLIFLLCNQTSAQLLGGILGSPANPGQPEGVVASLKGAIDKAFGVIEKNLEKITPPFLPNPPDPDKDPKGKDPKDNDPEGDNLEGDSPQGGDAKGNDSGSTGPDQPNSRANDNSESPRGSESNPADTNPSQRGSAGQDVVPTFGEISPKSFLDERSGQLSPPEFDRNPFGGDRIPPSARDWLNNPNGQFTPPQIDGNPFGDDRVPPFGKNWLDDPYGHYNPTKFDPKDLPDLNGNPFDKDRMKFDISGGQNIYHQGSDFNFQFSDKNTGLKGSLDGSQILGKPATGDAKFSFPTMVSENTRLTVEGNTNFDKKYDYGFQIEDLNKAANMYVKVNGDNGETPVKTLGMSFPLMDSNTKMLGFESEMSSDYKSKMKINFKDLVGGGSNYLSVNRDGGNFPVMGIGASIPIKDTPYTKISVEEAFGQEPVIKLNRFNKLENTNQYVKLSQTKGGDFATGVGTSFDIPGNALGVEGQFSHSSNNIKVTVDNYRTGSTTSLTAGKSGSRPSNLGLDTSIPLSQSRDGNVNLVGKIDIDGNNNVGGSLGIEATFP